MPRFGDDIKVYSGRGSSKVERTVVDKYGRVYLNFEPGNQYYVDSGVGSSANDGKTWGKTLDTVKNALAKVTASNGDVIWVAPGHTETIDSATDLAINKAGVTIIGLGNGSLRPTFTFSSTDNGANIPISVASVHLENILCICNDDGLTAGITISGPDCILKNVEWRDVTDVEAALAILTTAAADRLTIDGFFHNGYTGGNACTDAIRLVGVDSALIKNCRFHGNYGTAVIEFHTTACTKIDILDCVFNETGTTDLSKNVVDTVTGSTWFVKGYDLAAGCDFSGGSGAALAKDDISAVSTAVAAIQTDLGDPSARTNLQTILAILGNPDTVGATVWSALINSNTSFNSKLGTKVTKAKADVLDSVQNALFTVSGGRVLITHIEGEICDAAVDSESADVKFIFNPTVGSDSDMCAVGALDAAPVGTIFSITGLPSEALLFDTGMVSRMARELVVAEGTIDVLSEADNGQGGATAKFELWYIPLDSGASVAAT
jgi:hypothetical protein